MGDLWKKFKKQFSRYKDSTDIPEGIPNVGNTCYINVIVQVLKWTPGFRSMLEKCKTGDTKTCVASNLSEIMKTTDKAALLSLLRDLGELIGRNNLASGTQEDCFELYNLLLENLQSDIKESPKKLFEGSLFMTFSHDSCGHVERQLQQFTSLSLPINVMEGVNDEDGYVEIAPEQEAHEESEICKSDQKMNNANATELTLSTEQATKATGTNVDNNERNIDEKPESELETKVPYAEKIQTEENGSEVNTNTHLGNEVNETEKETNGHGRNERKNEEGGQCRKDIIIYEAENIANATEEETQGQVNKKLNITELVTGENGEKGTDNCEVETSEGAEKGMDKFEVERNEHGEKDMDECEVERSEDAEKGMDKCELETNEHGEKGKNKCELETNEHGEKDMDECEVEISEHGEKVMDKCEVERSEDAEKDMDICDEAEKGNRAESNANATEEETPGQVNKKLNITEVMTGENGEKGTDNCEVETSEDAEKDMDICDEAEKGNRAESNANATEEETPGQVNKKLNITEVMTGENGEKGTDNCEVETSEGAEKGMDKCEVETSKEHDMYISEEIQERRRKDEIVCRDEMEISQQGRKETNDRSEKRDQGDLENVTESETARASTEDKEWNQTITVGQANEQTEEKNQQFLNTFRSLLTKPIGKRSPTSEACIENSLARFIDNESHEEGMLPCRMCEHVRLNAIDPLCTKRILVADPPPILVLQLNRVRQVNRNGVMKLEKITDQITYPEYLDIHPFSSSFCMGKLPNCYQLYAVIVHVGNLGKGHYESYINVPDILSPPPHSCMETTQRPGVEEVLNKHENDPILLESYIVKYNDVSFPPPRKPVSSSTTSKWLKFNDRKVTRCKHPPHGDQSLSDAYMLFYHEIYSI